MSVERINGDVLIPHRPDWRQRVEWTRAWDTVIRDSVRGKEQRLALRPRGRVTVKFRFFPFDDIERQQFEDRMRAAMKDARAAIPFWGRGVRASGDVAIAATTVSIAEEPTFEWDNDDWLFIGRLVTRDWAIWETVQVDHFPGNGTVVLKTGLVNSYPAGCRFYPLVAGRVTFSDAELLDDWRASRSVSVEETGVRPVPEPATS